MEPNNAAPDAPTPETDRNIVGITKYVRSDFARKLERDRDAWKAAALVIGEKLTSVGPNGYYTFNATSWSAWCDTQLRSLERDSNHLVALIGQMRQAVLQQDWDEFNLLIEAAYEKP